MGEIPFSITNASLISNLDLEYNHLSGELPINIVRNLPGLDFLYLSYNDMVSSNLDPFFTSLGNCMSLKELQLAGMTNITRSIPPSLSNITCLMLLNLTSNLLSGTIPE